MKKLFIITSALLVTLLFAFGRQWFSPGIPAADAREEFKKILAEFHRDSNLHLTGTIDLYDKAESDSVKEQKTFAISRNGKQSFLQLDYLLNYNNGEITVLLDTVNRTILVAKTPQEQVDQQSMILQFEKFAADTANTLLTVANQGNSGMITVRSDLSPEIRSYTIHYDKASYRINLVDIEWWKGSLATEDASPGNVYLTRISYQYKDSGINDITKAIDKIIEKKGDVIEARPAFADYQLYTR